MNTLRTLSVALASLAVLAWLPADAAAADAFKIVAHPDVPVDRIARNDLARIFMKKEIQWSNGTPTVPVDRPAEADVRESFSRAVHQKGTSAVAAYWQKQIFSGRDVPPVTRASDADVVAFVASTPGAIGYVAPGASTSGVKTISVD